MLYYHISEDEYNALEKAMNQLGLLVGLLEITPDKKNLQSITGYQLFCFLNAQFSTLHDVADAVTTRGIMARQADPVKPNKASSRRRSREHLAQGVAA